MVSTATVGIVRHQQFRPSETFIPNQALALSTFKPLFVGRDSVPAPPGVESVSVSEHGRAATLSYTFFRSAAPLRRSLAERGVGLLHAHFGVEGVYATPTANSLNVPLITTLHGFDVTISKAKLLMSRKVSWINYVTWRHTLFDSGALFIAVSEHIRRRAVEWGYPADRTVVCPIGVDTDLIKPEGAVEAPRIVHVARLVEKKGTSVLLRAFAEVRKAVPDADLVIVGDGPLRGSLGELARELGIAPGVRFAGAQPYDVTLSEVKRSQVLCLPSVTAANGDQEGLGMVLLEAAAAGKPVVGTDHGGIPEAVVDGANGFLVAEHDAPGLAESLITLLRDPDRSRRFGEAGRAMVVDRFDLRTQTKRLEALYRSYL